MLKQVRALLSTMAVILMMSASAAEQQPTSPPPPPAFPYLDEKHFVVEALKSQQTDIRSRAVERLQNAYPTFSVPRYEIGVTGRHRRKEQRVNLVILNNVLANPGVRHTSSNLRTHSFNINWSQGAGEFVPMSPLKVEAYSETVKTTFLGATSAGLLTPVTSTYWNCFKESRKLTARDEEEKYKSATDTRTSERSVTDSVRVKAGADGAWGWGTANVEAEFTKALHRRYTTSLEHEIRNRSTVTVNREVELPALSSMEVSTARKLVTQAYLVQGRSVLDTVVGVNLLGVAGWPKPIGKWSEFIPDQGRRTVPLSATVLVDHDEMDINFGSVRSFETESECEEARLAKVVVATGDGSPRSVDERSNSNVASTTRTQTSLTPAEALGDTRSMFARTLARTTEGTSGNCKATASGSGSLSGDRAVVLHAVRIEECPFSQFISEGRALFNIKVIDSDDRGQQLTGFELRWRAESEKSFTVNDSESINLRGINRITEVTGYHFTDCSCRQK